METSSLLFHLVHRPLCRHTRQIGVHQAQQDRPIRKDKLDLRFLPDHQRLHGIIAMYRPRLPRLEEEDEVVDAVIEVDEAVEEEAEATEEGSSGVVNIEAAYLHNDSGMSRYPMKSEDKTSCKHRGLFRMTNEPSWCWTF